MSIVCLITYLINGNIALLIMGMGILILKNIKYENRKTDKK